MTDRIYNVAEMLKTCYGLKNKATTARERDYWEKEIYKWKNELMANNVNPDSIDTLKFQVEHGAFDDYPELKRQAGCLITH